MDIEKLIERLRHDANAYRNGDTLGRAYADQEDVLDRAVDTLSALQAENEKLRAERVELEQMAACVYYKQGGLCRYGEEDPANVCVFGPCPHQRSAQEVLAQLEQVKRERDDAVHDRMMMEQRIGELNARAEKAEAENAVLRRMQLVKIDGDTLELENEVSELRKKLEKAERERDAAISDLETIMAYGEADLDTCEFCKNGQCYERGGTKPCLPKWRGQKEE